MGLRRLRGGGHRAPDSLWSSGVLGPLASTPSGGLCGGLAGDLGGHLASGPGRHGTGGAAGRSRARAGARTTGGGRTHRSGAPGCSSRTSRRSCADSTPRSGGAAGGDEQAGHEQLELEARGGGANHGGQGLGGGVGGPRENGGPHGAGLQVHALELIDRQRPQRRTGLGTGQGDDEQVAQPSQQILHEAARVVPGGDDPVHHPEDAGAVARRDGVNALVEHGGVGVAQQGDGPLVVDAAVVRPADELVHDREGVAHRAAAGAHHEGEDAGADLDALGLAQVGEVALEDVGRDETEGVVVGARADGADDLLRLGGGEDELHVRRRLLDELEQRVEALRGDHVGLVEDEDLVAVAGRGEGGALTQVAGVVDAVVAGGVDLDDVEAAGAAGGEVPAGGAGAAGGVGGGLGAVEAAGQDARRRRLAAAARAGEEVGVGDAVGPQRRHERSGDVVLPDDLLEGVGAVAAVQSGGHGPSLIGRADTVRGTGRVGFHLARWVGRRVAA